MEITTLKSARPAESHEAIAEAIAAVEIAAVVMIDHQGLISFWNKGAEAIFGWTSEEALGQNLHEFLTPQRFRAAHREAYPHFLETGEGAATGKTLELAGLRRDGSEVPITLSLSAVRLKEGWGAVGILQDITDRQQMENDLILERLQLFSIFDGMVDAVYVVDPETHELLYMNSTSVNYWGNGVGQKCHRVIHGLDQPCSFCNNDQLFGDNVGTSLLSERKNLATGHWFRCVNRAIRLSDGREVRLEIAFDITEKKNEELALIKVLDEAQQASLTKSYFLANMSHELRTPLNGMIGMMQLLEATRLDDEQKEFVAIAADSGNALLTMVDDLLDFSKLESGTLSLDPQSFDLPLVFKQALAHLSAQAREKKLTFASKVEPDVPGMVRGFPNRLRKILFNVAGNAIKFTSEGEVAVRLGLEKVFGDRAVLRFTVTDTGIGIDREKLEEIFSAFSQADSSFSRQYGGLGLGLALAQRLVETMGGRIGVESDGPDKGSTFWFTVKLDLVS